MPVYDGVMQAVQAVRGAAAGQEPYPPEVRAKAAAMLADGMRALDVARVLGLHRNTIVGWRRQDDFRRQVAAIRQRRRQSDLDTMTADVGIIVDALFQALRSKGKGAAERRFQAGKRLAALLGDDYRRLIEQRHSEEQRERAIAQRERLRRQAIERARAEQ